MFLKNNILLSIFAIIALSGCFKKDLDDFKKINSTKYTPEFAAPFINKEITLKDTIPSTPLIPIITMSDTASVKLPASNSKDTLESIIDKVDFKIYIENTFPINGTVQLYFADSNGVFIDSLLTNTDRIVPLATPVLIKEITISVDKERYKKLTQDSEQMYLYYSISTGTINGISQRYLRFNVGVKAKLSIDLFK